MSYQCLSDGSLILFEDLDNILKKYETEKDQKNPDLQINLLIQLKKKIESFYNTNISLDYLFEETNKNFLKIYGFNIPNEYYQEFKRKYSENKKNIKKNKFENNNIHNLPYRNAKIVYETWEGDNNGQRYIYEKWTNVDDDTGEVNNVITGGHLAKDEDFEEENDTPYLTTKMTWGFAACFSGCALYLVNLPGAKSAGGLLFAEGCSLIIQSFVETQEKEDIKIRKRNKKIVKDTQNKAY